MLKKDVIMAQNIKLLGFACASSSTAAFAVPGGMGSAAASAQATELHPSMFDRPNEKLLFRILHFLLLKLKPRAAQVPNAHILRDEFRFCWPITTPQDKTSFKKAVQDSMDILLRRRKAILHDLEKQDHLPIGSSQASRINTGCGPRVVDLIWRLSTLVIKASLEQESSNNFAPVLKLEGVSTAYASLALKAKIAMKTHSLKEKSIERSYVQDEWVAFASTLTEKIQELSVLQQRVYEDQNRLDTTVNRDFYSHMGESQRSTKIQNLEVAWTCIDDVLKDPVYARIQLVLNTAAQYNDDQPVLAAENLQLNQATRERRGNNVLSDVVKSTETLIRMARDGVERGGVHDVDDDRKVLLLNSSSQHVPVLHSMVLQLQQLLSQMKEANEIQARGQYIRMATTTANDSSRSATKLSAASQQFRLCPLTPAQLLEQENHLVQSLKKVSMKELTALAAEAVRKSNQRKENDLLSSGDAKPQPSASLVNEDEVHRKLDYDNGDEYMEP